MKCKCVTEEVMLAEEDKNAEEKSLDGAWYKRKHNPNSGEGCRQHRLTDSQQIKIQQNQPKHSFKNGGACDPPPLVIK